MWLQQLTQFLIWMHPLSSIQSDLLADLLEVGSFSDSPSPTSAWGVTRGSHDPTRPTTEVANLVGSQPDNLEPPTELSPLPCFVTDLNEKDYLVPGVCNFSMNANLESVDPSRCSSTDELLPEAELEKLLHPFADSILNTNCDLDCWDIESLLVV